MINYTLKCNRFTISANNKLQPVCLLIYFIVLVIALLIYLHFKSNLNYLFLKYNRWDFYYSFRIKKHKLGWYNGKTVLTLCLSLSETAKAQLGAPEQSKFRLQISTIKNTAATSKLLFYLYLKLHTINACLVIYQQCSDKSTYCSPPTNIVKSTNEGVFHHKFAESHLQFSKNSNFSYL